MLEYEQLKEEQRLRIGTRDNLVYATLGSFALLGGALLQTDLFWLLMLVPPVCVVLGWTYLANDQKISAIRRYLVGVLSVALAELSESPSAPVLGWEQHHRLDRGRLIRKIGQVAVNLTVFCLPGVSALLACVAIGGVGPFAAVVVIEGLALLFLAYQLIRNADIA